MNVMTNSQYRARALIQMHASVCNTSVPDISLILKLSNAPALLLQP